jgi:hypothetical protein
MTLEKNINVVISLLQGSRTGMTMLVRGQRQLRSTIIINSMDGTPASYASSYSDIQQIPKIFKIPKVHYRVHKSPAPVPVLSQISPFQTPPPCSLYPSYIGAGSFETSVSTHETTCRNADSHDLITTFIFAAQFRPVLHYVTCILHAYVLFWLQRTSRDETTLFGAEENQLFISVYL